MQIPQWKSQLEERLKCLSTLKKHQKPYFVLGANFGPYYEEVFRSVYLDFFKETFLKSVKMFVLEINIPNHYF